MIDNKTTPSSPSPNSSNESLQNNPARAEGENMVSHTTTTTNNNNDTLMPTPSPAKPSSDRVIVLSQDQREDINSSVMVGSKRGYMGTPITTTTTTDTNNDTLIESTPTPAQPTSDRFIDLPQESRDDIPTSSSKKPRGRPPGSKNKPKPPEENNGNNMKMIFIEIPAGKDIVGDIINCAQRHQASITVLRGYGLVTDVTLLNPETHFPTPPMKGPFEMTSLFGTYVNNAPSQFINDPPCSCFSIFLSGHGAQVYAGTVGGTIIAASDVRIEATLCKNLKHYQAVSNNNIDN